MSYTEDAICAERGRWLAEIDAALIRAGEDESGGYIAYPRRIDQLAERAERAEDERNGAYRERAQLVALLAAAYPAVLAPAPDVEDDGWRILYLDLQGWQCSWHIAPTDLDLFTGVEQVDGDDVRAQWDGHTTEEKYQRIAHVTARLHGQIAQPFTGR